MKKEPTSKKVICCDCGKPFEVGIKSTAAKCQLCKSLINRTNRTGKTNKK